MKKEIFEIETAEGFAQFEGITFGQRWNGWECPQFDIDNINKILEGLGSEDEAKDSEARVQKQLDNCIAKIDSMIVDKEKEIMTV